jgi:hypothetical protein
LDRGEIAANSCLLSDAARSPTSALKIPRALGPSCGSPPPQLKRE